MSDFNDFINNNSKNDTKSQNVFDVLTKLANKYDGKSQGELLNAIYTEAKKGKINGTLTNSDIDNFVSVLAPILDEKKKKMLISLANDLKKL